MKNKYMKLTLPATISKVETRVDNTISIKLETQELNPQDAATLFTLKGKLGYCLFALTELQETDIPKDTPIVGKKKSQSERLRSVIFVYWKQEWETTYANFEDFKTFYMEQLIDQVKEKLNG